VIGAAALLRLWGLTHDVPFNYYPDEAHFVKRSLAFGSGDLNPHWFHKPALFMYLLFAEYGAYFVVGMGLGIFSSVDEFARHYFADPTMFYVLGRLTVALFGVATVYMLWSIGRRFGGDRVGLMAALFLAVMFAHVRGSHFIKADVPATFFSVMAFWFLIRLFEDGRRKDYIWSGVMAGLGTATKYYSVALLPSIWLAHFLREWKAGSSWIRRFVDWKITLAGVFWLLAFFGGAPFNFIDFETFKNTMITPPPIPGSARAAGIDPGPFHEVIKTAKGVVHASALLLRPSAFGPAMGIAAYAGLAVLLVRRRKKDLLLLSAILIYFLLATKHHHVHLKTRHLLPMYPFLCLGAAIAVDRLLALSLFRGRQWATALACLVVALPGAYESVKLSVSLSRPETRTIAKDWIEANIPAGTRILLDAKGPPLSNSRENLQAMYDEAKQETRPGAFTTHLEKYFRYQLETAKEHTYDLTQIHQAWWSRQELSSEVSEADSEFDLDFGNPVYERGVMPLDYYRENGYEFVVTTSSDYNTYLYGKRKDSFPSVRAFYEELFAEAELVVEFNRDEGWSRGPVVRIFALEPLEPRDAGNPSHTP
jgi:hypothetical protein